MGLKIVKKNRNNLAVSTRYGYICTQKDYDTYKLKEEP